MRITLPEILGLRSIEACLAHNFAPNQEIQLDMSRLRRTYPAGLLPLVSVLRRHVSAGGRVQILEYPALAPCNYLRGMNFYDDLEVCSHEHTNPDADAERYVGIVETGSPTLPEAVKAKLNR